jgi:hypothetical protein
LKRRVGERKKPMKLSADYGIFPGRPGESTGKTEDFQSFFFAPQMNPARK